MSFRLGLFDCDPLPLPVQQSYGDYPAMFARLFAMSPATIHWQVYDATQCQLPTKMNECDAYIISGSHFGVMDDEPWIHTLHDWLQQAWASKTKVIGICFGHQLMAKAMGGDVNRAPVGWRMGTVETNIIAPQTWMNPSQTRFTVCASHQDQVLTQPPSATCIATTSHCPFAILQYDQTFLSLQGHPEFEPTYTRYLINKRRTLFDTTTYQGFIDSLSKAPDTHLLASWLTAFLGTSPSSKGAK